MSAEATIKTEDFDSLEGETSVSGVAKGMFKKFRERIAGWRAGAGKLETSTETVSEDGTLPGESRAVDIESEKAPEFPDDPESIDGKINLGGSSGVTAGYFNGELLVVKKARREEVAETGMRGELNTGQLVDEYIADKIYEAMGFGVPTSKIYAGGTHKISKFIQGKDADTFSEDQPEFAKIKEAIQGGFALDCLLANWDVLGTGGGGWR